MSTVKPAQINYNKMFYQPGGPYLRVLKEHPEMPSKEVLKIYRNYLHSLSLVDPTPANDVIGWLVRRMTGQRTLDAIVSVYGDRGNGKSYVCGYIGERVDKRLCHLTDAEPGSYFTIDNVRSVDKSGSLEMLTPKNMREKPNQVYVLDDASIATNARNFQSEYNKNLNAILTTARIYRHCIIMNTVSSNMIDAIARSFADIGILVKGLLPGTTINECRVFRMGQTNHMGFGKGAKENSGKYFHILVNGEQHRMKTWYTNKPSEAWCDAYDKLRKENTDRLGSEEDGDFEGYAPKKKQSKREAMHDEAMKKFDVVVARYNEMTKTGKPNISKIARESGISREWVNVILTENTRRIHG